MQPSEYLTEKLRPLLDADRILREQMRGPSCKYHNTGAEYYVAEMLLQVILDEMKEDRRHYNPPFYP